MPDPAVGIAAEIGSLAFTTGFARWIEPGHERECAELAREALDELVVATATLS